MIMAVIPARSGSKTIKDKCIKPLNGLPLLVWSIKVAQACKQIDKVVVSSDSQEYLNIAEEFGAKTILRPVELAADETAMLPVLQHAVKEVESKGEHVNVVVLLDPTSPLRLVGDIDKCLEKINEPLTDSVVTVTEAEHNPYFIMGTIDHNDYWQYPLVKTEKSITRRQDAPKVYQLNASVYVIKAMVIESGKIFTSKTKVVIMPSERSVHIDTEMDFKMAEFLIKEKYIKTA